MAEVWEGHDEVLSRPVAVKILQQHLASDGIFLERFRREAVTAARLAHPCVVATYDTGIDSGTPYIVMELVPGETLRQCLSAQGRLEPRVAFHIARQITDALVEAHAAGLVHRDIKPANILLLDDRWGGLRVKVTDFGIAKASEGLGADLTRTGTVLGTPKYLSPEQIRGLEPDSRADLYSLGVVIFEMLAGEPPYSESTDMATALAHLNDRIPRLSRRVRGLPDEVDQLNADLLAKDPAGRVPSALALRDRIDGMIAIVGTAPRGFSAAAVNDPTTPGQPPASRSRDRLDTAAARASTGQPAPPIGQPAPPIGQPAPATGQRAAAGPTPKRTGNGAGRRQPADDPGTVAGTVAIDIGDPPTDPYGTAAAAASERRRDPGSSNRRRVGLVVGALLLIGLVVGAVLLSSSSGGSRGAPKTAPTTPSQSGTNISSVSVFMVNSRQPDNPQDTGLTFDGNPVTVWPTDQYSSPTFGNLYPGIGLEIHLSQPEQGSILAVTSPNSGWAAETFVSETEVPSGQPVSVWGAPTDSRSGIGAGTSVFRLGNKRSQWILLWITNLGPTDQGRIAELAVR